MTIKIKRGNAVTVQLYAPLSSSEHAMHELSEFAGGCTILEGKGEWLHNGVWTNEPVRKYEWVFTEYAQYPLELGERLCTAFLNDNPQEIEVLCTVNAEGKTIYVRCTRA